MSKRKETCLALLTKAHGKTLIKKFVLESADGSVYISNRKRSKKCPLEYIVLQCSQYDCTKKACQDCRLKW